jgi:hypothetical protein
MGIITDEKHFFLGSRMTTTLTQMMNQLWSLEVGLPFLGMVAIMVVLLLNRMLKGRKMRRRLERELLGRKGYKRADNRNGIPIASSSSSSTTTSDTSIFADLYDKCQLPLHRLAVHTDLPRLCLKFQIYLGSRHSTATRKYCSLPADYGSSWRALLSDEYDAESLRFEHFDVDKHEGDRDSLYRAQLHCRMRDILRTLSAQLHVEPDAVPLIDKQFLRHERAVKRDAARDVMTFLDEHLGDGHRVVRVLKACNQATLAPAVIRMKVDIGATHPYKDKRGSWHIDIAFVEDADELVVVHRKRECSWGGEQEPASHFEFSWHLMLFFDAATVTLRAVKLHITDVFFNRAMAAADQQRVLRVLSNYMEHEDDDLK